MILRGSVGATLTAYELSIRGDGVNAGWQKVVANAVTSLPAGSIIHTFVTGDIVKVQINGTIITYANGTLIGQFSDASIASGAAGLNFFTSASIVNTGAIHNWSAGFTNALPNNWGTKSGVNFRATLAGPTSFPGDPAGTVFANNGGALGIVPYGQSLTVSGNTFLSGWVVTASGVPITPPVDGSRDRVGTIDPRLAGRQAAVSTNTNCSYKLQVGVIPGTYKMWLGICDQDATVSPDHSTITVRDSSSTLFTVAGLGSITAGNVYDATGALYTAASLWAGTADTSGIAVSFTTNDGSNGNGGPFIFIDCGGSGNAGIPLAHVAFQYVSAPTPQVSFIAVLP